MYWLVLLLLNDRGQLGGHLVVVAVEDERTGAIEVAICELECLDAIIPWTGHYCHQSADLILCDAIR